jgi:hypothetical protein
VRGEIFLEELVAWAACRFAGVKAGESTFKVVLVLELGTDTASAELLWIVTETGAGRVCRRKFGDSGRK